MALSEAVSRSRVPPFHLLPQILGFTITGLAHDKRIGFTSGLLRRFGGGVRGRRKAAPAKKGELTDDTYTTHS